MSGRTPSRSRSSGLATLLLLGAALLGVVRSAYAQTRTPQPIQPRGVPVTVEPDWLLNVDAATLTVSPLAYRSARDQRMLLVTLQMQNLATSPRLFPVDRLHLLDGAGSALADTWCGGDANPLELTRQIAPGGGQFGDVCWLVSGGTSDELADLVLSIDATGTAARDQGAMVAVGPVTEAVARIVPTPLLASTPMPATALDAGGLPAPNAVSGLDGGVSPAGSSVAPRSPNLAAPSGSLMAPGSTPIARGPCAGPYSVQADNQGSYLNPECAAASSRRRSPASSTQLASAAATQTGALSPALLYPSANQPAGISNMGPAVTPTVIGARVTPTPYGGGYQSTTGNNSNGVRP